MPGHRWIGALVVMGLVKVLDDLWDGKELAAMGPAGTSFEVLKNWL